MSFFTRKGVIAYVLFLCFSSNSTKASKNQQKVGVNLAELNIRQDRFLKALLQSASIDEACKVAGINRTTGYKYLKDQDFITEYRLLRREAMQQVTSQLQKKAEEAVGVLAEVMNDKEAPAGSRVQSAKNVLDAAYRSIELDDIAERVEEVERFMDEK